MKQLQHDTSIAVMHEIMDQIGTEIPSERRLSMVYLIYYTVMGAIEKYEEMVERRHDRLYGPHTSPSSN